MRLKVAVASVLCVGVTVPLFAQMIVLSAPTIASDSLHAAKPRFAETALPHPATLRASLLDVGSSAENPSQTTVPPEHRALFCRFDDALDRKGVPLRMRLGTLEDVNRKEGKPGYR